VNDIDHLKFHFLTLRARTSWIIFNHLKQSPKSK
jgi:hypothetical protein